MQSDQRRFSKCAREDGGPTAVSLIRIALRMPAALTAQLRQRIALSRCGVVIMCILCTVWLARDPEWEALIALLGAFGTYVGLELTQRGEPASQSDDGCTVECAARVEHETEHRILQHLATEGASDMAELIAALGLTQFEAEHYCGRLELIGYVTTSTARVYRRQYRLTRRAKEYVRQQRVAQREFRLPDTACNLATAGSKDPSAVTAMNRRSRDRFAE